jgi:hypothetical protein
MYEVIQMISDISEYIADIWNYIDILEPHLWSFIQFFTLLAIQSTKFYSLLQSYQ